MPQNIGARRRIMMAISDDIVAIADRSNDHEVLRGIDPITQLIVALGSVEPGGRSGSSKVATVPSKSWPSVKLIGTPTTSGTAAETWATAMRAAAMSKGVVGAFPKLLSAQAGCSKPP